MRLPAPRLSASLAWESECLTATGDARSNVPAQSSVREVRTAVPSKDQTDAGRHKNQRVHALRPGGKSIQRNIECQPNLMCGSYAHGRFNACQFLDRSAIEHFDLLGKVAPIHHLLGEVEDIPLASEVRQHVVGIRNSHFVQN